MHCQEACEGESKARSLLCHLMCFHTVIHVLLFIMHEYTINTNRNLETSPLLSSCTHARTPLADAPHHLSSVA